jgi:hypothetical protein
MGSRYRRDIRLMLGEARMRESQTCCEVPRPIYELEGFRRLEEGPTGSESHNASRNRVPGYLGVSMLATPG